MSVTTEEEGPGARSAESASARPREKTAAGSRVSTSQLMRPQHANFSNNVHGGVMMGLMDEAAYLCATSYAEHYCVTASVDEVSFRSPVSVGDRVTLEAAVHSVGRSSMKVGITVYAEDPRRPESRRVTNHSFFTMVALDHERRPAPVPRLICETADDLRLRCEADLRAELQREFRERLATGMCSFAPDGEATGGAVGTVGARE